jgi:DNA-binding Lrp family transcriptional regulator
MIDKDQALLNLLKTNARVSISELARELGISRTTVQQRIQRLEENQIIDGYTIRMGNAAQRSRIQAHTNISIEANASKSIVEILEKIPVIETLYTVSGKIDLIAIINVTSAGELDQYLDQVSAIQGVKSTETAIVLTTKFDRR